MKSMEYTKYEQVENLTLKEENELLQIDEDIRKAFAELKRSVHAALETYSNIHRGSGHNSMVSTHLYEQARHIVLEYLGLEKNKYIVIFCSPRNAERLKAQLNSEHYHCLSSNDFGLPLGVRAIAVKHNVLPKGAPFISGGGSARLLALNWVVWAKAPDKFEAGTPSIINVIAFAKALQLIQRFGADIFNNMNTEKHTAKEILYHDELDGYFGHELLDKLRQTLIGKNSSVPTTEGNKPFINFDNAASTPTFEPIWRSVYQTWQPSLQAQTEIVNEVKSICANALGAPLSTYDVLFTANTTEAINLVAESLGKKLENSIEPIVLNTLLEHTSNELPWRTIPGYSQIRLTVNNEGFIDVKLLETLLSEYNQKAIYGKKRIRLVAVSGASNVLGSFNDLAEISRIVHKYGAQLLVDAAQLVAHRRIEMAKNGIDYLAFSAHKVYAPFGSGVLVSKKGLLNFKPTELEQIKASGEENTGGIAALGKALVLLQRIGLEIIQKEEQDLTAYLLQCLNKIPSVTIYGVQNQDSPRFDEKGGVIVFSVKGIMSDKIATKLAHVGGIGVRYGCHCAHIMVKQLLNISPFLEQFQRLIVSLFPKVQLPGVARVSLGIENTKEEVDKLIEVLQEITSKPISGANIKQKMLDFVNEKSERVYLLKENI